MKMMRGATPVRIQVARFMKDEYPAMRQRALRAWDVKDAKDLPECKVFNPFDNIQFSPETSPVIGVDVNRATDFRATDLSDVAEEEYRARYNVRLNFWVYSRDSAEGETLGPQRASAIRMRDDSVGIIMNILLNKPSLGCNFLNFDKTTLTVDYHFANPSPNTSGRYFAGAQLTFNVESDEWMDHTPVGTVDSIGIEVDGEVMGDRAKYFSNIDKFPG